MENNTKFKDWKHKTFTGSLQINKYTSLLFNVLFFEDGFNLY